MLKFVSILPSTTQMITGISLRDIVDCITFGYCKSAFSQKPHFFQLPAHLPHKYLLLHSSTFAYATP
ncbi:hypothetical protein [Hydrotalea sp.]|uniref:hypothetical protein n=1 Tax=Hydrotalea sp. TaxID=2881279 RepID=UPI0026321A7D|nr:hypothetical protein [Hydrotalea sp.]